MLLALIAHDHAGPTLVVAPTSVVGNWVREAERFAPGLRVAVHHGGDRGDPAPDRGRRRHRGHELRRDAPRRAARARSAGTASCSTKPRRSRTPRPRRPRPPRALTAQHRIAATGTPVENHLGELWSIMTFANPGLLGTRAAFTDQYRMTGEPTTTRDRARASPRADRRVRLPAHQDRPGIVDELPERIVVRDDCMLTREQVALYEATAAAMLGEVADAPDAKRRRLHVFAGIAKLKQICNHPASLDRGRHLGARRSLGQARPAGRADRARSSPRTKPSSCSASTRRSCAGSHRTWPASSTCRCRSCTAGCSELGATRSSSSSARTTAAACSRCRCAPAAPG